MLAFGSWVWVNPGTRGGRWNNGVALKPVVDHWASSSDSLTTCMQASDMHNPALPDDDDDDDHHVCPLSNS